MIKSTDPTASVFGPSDFTLGGWIGTSADMTEHGGLYAGQWYLQQMQGYQAKNGARILDYFDEHVYGGSTTDNNYELQSTRSLWDPSYNSGTWVEQWYFGNMQLIPRFQSWIAQYYPGTKLAFSEYRWGQHNTLAGALAEADILGIFGRQQVDFANMWDAPKATDPTAYIFRLYRNYDGNGGAFGDTGVTAGSADQTQLAVYGAQRTADGALTLVVINKTANELTSALSLSHFNAAGQAHMFTYSGANLQAIAEQPDLTVVNSSITASFPAQSASIVLIPQASGPLPRNGWKAAASSSAPGTVNGVNQQPASALDGNIKTRWSSGHHQSGGEWFSVDMGSAQRFSSLTLNAGSSTYDYPRGYKLYTSTDNKTWTGPVAQGVGTSALTTITFAPQTARYLKIVQTGTAPVSWWSIAEINVNP